MQRAASVGSSDWGLACVCSCASAPAHLLLHSEPAGPKAATTRVGALIALVELSGFQTTVCCLTPAEGPEAGGCQNAQGMGRGLLGGELVLTGDVHIL